LLSAPAVGENARIVAWAALTYNAGGFFLIGGVIMFFDRSMYVHAPLNS
jgi:hypothetical protein